MSMTDLTIKSYILWRILPACSIVLILFAIKKKHKAIGAWLLSCFEGPMNRATFSKKQKLFSDLVSSKFRLGRDLKILEIGAGTGANFLFYPPGCHMTCLDPVKEFSPYIQSNAKKHRISIDRFIYSFAEKMHMIDSESIDVVVCTFVLCTVKSQEKVLQEVKRILKPGGKFYFMEHICSEKRGFIYLMQILLNPVWKIFAGGCEIKRNTPATLNKAGFTKCHVERFNGVKPFVFVVRPLCMGILTK